MVQRFHKASISKFKEYFDNMNINWIVTTNYDTILESILTGKCLPLGPQECFYKIHDLIPIYHIHGIRTDPYNIIITNEDYVSLFRPNDYRQSRLPFLIKESIVLMIGYGIGDINVISALDWSKNVYTNLNKNYDAKIIQLLYTDSPKDKPYEDSYGVIIMETNNISEFLEQLNYYYNSYLEEYLSKKDKIKDYMSLFIEKDDGDTDLFISDRTYRIELIQYIANLNIEFSYIYPSYMSFLQKVISELNSRSSYRWAFSAYDEKLKVLIDILIYEDIKKFNLLYLC